MIDRSLHDRAILRGEEAEALGESHDSKEARQSGDFEVLKGYVDDLEKHYGIEIPKKVLERLGDLEKFTKPHNRDARVIYEAFFQIFHWRRKEGYGADTLDLPEADLGVGLAASLLHDIGKSGPANALARRRELVSRLYNLEALPNGRSTPINDAVRLIVGEAMVMGKGGNMVEKLRDYLTDLRNLGIEPNDLMPSFWRMHSLWTKQILEKFCDQSDPVFRRITKIASSHHFFEGNNPEGIDFQAQNLSVEERRDMYLIKLLIVLDQYQGRRHRGYKNPEQAQQFIQDKLAKHGLADDLDFKEILSLVERVEKNTAIFKLGGELDAEVRK